MIAALFLLMRKGMLDLGRSPLHVFTGECLASLTGLTVYWFTSKALGPAVNFGGDYFTYVVVGEVALFLPLALWNGVATAVRGGANDGTLELFMSLPRRVSWLCALQSLTQVPRELFRILLMLTVAHAIFGLALPPHAPLTILVISLSSVPLFLAMGAVAAAALLKFRRGLSALAHGGTLAAVFAGAYFPLGTFPEPLPALSRAASPFTWVLTLARNGLSGGWSGKLAGQTALLFLGGTAILLLALLILDLSFTAVRKHGEPILFSE